MKKIFYFLSLVLVFSLLLACGKKETKKELVMGFVPFRDSEKLVEEIKPLEEMLSKEMGITVKGFIATNYVGIVEGFGTGEVDFGLIPPFASVLAQDEYKAKPLLVVLNKKGEATYQSQILVRKDSNIKSIEDIKGKRVAFVGPSSSSGYIFPAGLIKEHGIDPEKDVKAIFSGGHDKSLQLLLNGDVDVIATYVDIRDRHKEEFSESFNITEVLTYTEPIPGISVTASSKMDEETAQKLKVAFKNVVATEEGKKLLSELFNIYGVEDAKAENFDVIRKTAKLLDLDLKEQK